MDTTPGITLNHGGTGHQVWLPLRSGDERSHPMQMNIMLNSRGERMTKALEGTEVEQQTPSKWGWETSGEQAVMAFHTRSSVALGDYPRWGGWPLINLITMHNNDLIYNIRGLINPQNLVTSFPYWIDLNKINNINSIS